MSIHYGENAIQPIASVGTCDKNRHSLKAHHAHQKTAYRHIGKRLFDLTICLIAAPFAIPLIALLALIIRCDGGKSFYTQNRIGRNGRNYKMWKLRSMVSDADGILKSYLASNPEAQAEWDKDQKLKSDPRITKFGQLLRKSSLDELPQLWNVVRGEMSLVGPRPMMPCQKALYPGTHYYNLLPGISGSWQISERNTSSFAERATFDEQYDNDLSLREDIRILKATVGVVFKATGY